MSTKSWGAAGALLLALATGQLVSSGPAVADGGHRSPLTLAVFGDSPYGTSPTDTSEFGDTPAFIDTINADKDVSSVVHVGDIHSGSQYCTEAYDRSVQQLWTRFATSLVYTPGDNEWSDCHKKKEGGGVFNPATGQVDYVTDSSGNPVDYAKGDPVANLDLVRSVFFPRPGRTLGAGDLRVESQAQHADRRHPADRAYVENVTWQRAGVQFVTINVPGGSNNDADPWYGAPVTAAQTDEAAARTAADLRWLDHAFAEAREDHAKGVVVITQADMWDLDGKDVSHLSGYEPIVQALADHTNRFGKQVLLLNGDSHVYRSDNPFSATAPCATEGAAGATVPCAASVAATHPGYDVPGFHRVTVHGSTFPLEWLKLTVDPQGKGAFGPFSWSRVTTTLGS